MPSIALSRGVSTRPFAVLSPQDQPPMSNGDARPPQLRGDDVDAVGPEGEEPPKEMSVAELDSLKFELGPSVKFWKEWTRTSPLDDLANFVQNPNSFEIKASSSIYPATLSDWGLDDTRNAGYWGYHLFRSSFFVAQAAAGLAAANASQQTGNSVGMITTQTGLGMYMEALQMFRQDLANINAGHYKAPYDMDPRHRQFDPMFVLERSRRFLKEASATLKRRSEGKAEDVWLRSRLYPEYYMNTWHYQTDGWMSSESAGVYETSTETLFLGQQDAMQRQTLVPLAKHLKGKDTSSMRLLEVAAGTGRFATFIKDNYPEMVSPRPPPLSPFSLSFSLSLFDRQRLTLRLPFQLPNANTPHPTPARDGVGSFAVLPPGSSREHGALVVAQICQVHRVLLQGRLPAGPCREAARG